MLADFKRESIKNSSQVDSSMINLEKTGTIRKNGLDELSYSDKSKLFRKYIVSIPANYSNAWEEDEFLFRNE